VSDYALPGDVRIVQSRPLAVTVSLYLDKISDYKLVPLKDPDRLVLEVYYPTDDRQDAAVSLSAPAKNASPSTPVSPPAPSVEHAAPTPAPPAVAETPIAPAPPTPPPPPQNKAQRRSVRDDIKTIVIDPGHGGKDPGAIGRGKLAEKHITLQVGL